MVGHLQLQGMDESLKERSREGLLDSPDSGLPPSPSPPFYSLSPGEGRAGGSGGADPPAPGHRRDAKDGKVPASLSTDFCRTVSQWISCQMNANFYLHSGAMMDSSMVPESALHGGRRFQLHLKCRGGGCLAPWHSLHRDGPNNGVHISVCTKPVGFMADIKKKAKPKTPLPDNPAILKSP
ncbi:refilin-A isoform X2 [Pezoporus occidentalis]|uniref:refilin-A isoform X2 n=1 Tax=Pezoporus occidentalis TaxID=407982 RepID=UPI002F909D63